jgi:mono/diheme cytochrome c family protein
MPKLSLLVLLLQFPPAALLALPPQFTCPEGGTPLRWEGFGLPFFEQNCNRCHGWRSYTFVYEQRLLILNLVTSNNMPPFRPVPLDVKSKLIDWIACDMPLDGPQCPPGGTTSGYEGTGGAVGFGEVFFSEHCLGCHASDLEGLGRHGAPINMNWDSYADVVKFSTSIRDQVVRGLMPPGGFVPPEETDQLLEWIACGAPKVPQGAAYLRGDPNDDGNRDISDAISILFFLFTGSASLSCRDAADIDANGQIQLTDALSLLRYLFLLDGPPPPPFEACGGPLRMGCGEYRSC